MSFFDRAPLAKPCQQHDDASLAEGVLCHPGGEQDEPSPVAYSQWGKSSGSARMKQGMVVAEGGKPLQFLNAVDNESPQTPEQANAIVIASAIKAYRASASDLLKGKYASLASIAPRHFRESCDVLVLRCSDGVLVRFDVAVDDATKIRAGATDTSLRDVAPGFSDGIIRLDVDPSDLPGDGVGMRFQMGVVDPTGTATQMRAMTFVLVASSQLPDGFKLPGPPSRPPCLVSVLSEIDLQIGGYLVPVDAGATLPPADVKRFIAQSRIQLPVGWMAIEVYPLLEDKFWEPAFAASWAELDILATAATRNLQEASLTALDSRGESRRLYAALLDEFERLLEGLEEPMHQFLRAHPELICPTSDRFWSKLAFGSTVSDFVFREPHNDYELVELEAPIRALFRKDGQQRQELTHAINQIADWLSFIQDNKRMVEDGLGLRGISTSPRTLIVIGRSTALTDANRRKLTTLQNQIAKLRILTYDDLLAAARANLERILGPLSLRGDNVSFYFFD